MKTTYIYTLSDPDTNEIKYVGKTICISRRYIQHISNSNFHKQPVKSWCCSLIKKNKFPIIEILDETNDNWAELEQYWIYQLKNWGFKLKNLTDGGEGMFGYKLTKEQCENRSLKLTGRKCSDKTLLALSQKGKIRTKEFREKMSLARIGNVPWNKGLKTPIEVKQKQSIAHLGKKSANRRCILQLKDDIILNEYPSILDAAQAHNISDKNIIAVLKNRRNKCGGFQWKYKI